MFPCKNAFAMLRINAIKFRNLFNSFIIFFSTWTNVLKLLKKNHIVFTLHYQYLVAWIYPGENIDSMADEIKKTANIYNPFGLRRKIVLACSNAALYLPECMYSTSDKFILENL